MYTIFNFFAVTSGYGLTKHIVAAVPYEFYLAEHYNPPRLTGCQKLSIFVQPPPVTTLLQTVDVDLNNKLGEGGYGIVYAGKYDGKPVAVKLMDYGTRHHRKRSAVTELKINKMISTKCHAAIAQPIGMRFDFDECEAILVMELCKGEELSELLKSDRLTDCQKLSIFVQFVHAVKFLHDRGITHRDLKPHNAVFDAETNSLKLIDFGIASFKMFQDVTKDMSRPGTRGYRAPEVADPSGNYNLPATDIWGLGVILWQLFERRDTDRYPELPFDRVYDRSLLVNIQAKIEFTILPPNSPIRQMISCLFQDTKERPTIRQLVDHRMIQNWERVRDLESKRCHLVQSVSGGLQVN